MKPRGPADRRVSKALAILDPPELERETCRKQIEKVLDLWEFLTEHERDELEIGLRSTQGKAALKRIRRRITTRGHAHRTSAERK